MSLSGKICLVPVIGAALLISGCDSSHHNTTLTGAQKQVLGTEILVNIFDNLGASFGTGVEITPGFAGRKPVAAAVLPNCTGTSPESCTIPTTTLNCISNGSVAVSGTFTDTLNTTTNVRTVNLTNIDLVPTNCSSDNNVLVTGKPKVTIAGTGIAFDVSTGDVRVPFTVTAVGTVSFAPGSADPSFPSGQCDLNVTATFEQVPATSAPPVQVQAAVTGSLCGKTIAAGTTVPVGTF